MPAVARSETINYDLDRTSATVATLSRRKYTSGLVGIQNWLVNLADGDITLTVGASADDLLEGGSPSASTLYNLYLKWLASGAILRLSATAPGDDGYRTGDPAALFIGAVYLDGSKEIAQAWNIAGVGEQDAHEEYLSSNIVKSSGSIGDWTEILKISNVVIVPNTVLDIAAYLFAEGDAAMYFASRLRIDSTTVVDAAPKHGSASFPVSYNLVYKKSYDAISSILLEFESQYDGNTKTIFGNGSSRTKISLSRRTP